MYRVWYVKHGESGKFVNRNEVPSYFEEGLSLSPEYSMLYNINKNSPNPYLAKFGYIVSNIPGDAVVIYESDGKIKNIPFDFEKKFPQILKHDEYQRYGMVEEMASMGITPIMY